MEEQYNTFELHEFESLFIYITSSFVFEDVYLYPEHIVNYNYTDGQKDFPKWQKDMDRTNKDMPLSFDSILEIVESIYNQSLKRNKDTIRDTLVRMDEFFALSSGMYGFEKNQIKYNVPGMSEYNINRQLRNYVTHIVYNIMGDTLFFEWVDYQFDQMFDQVRRVRQYIKKKEQVIAYIRNYSTHIYITDGLDHLHHVANTLSKNRTRVFFRGHDEVGHSLIPSLYRHTEHKRNEDKMVEAVLENQYKSFNQLYNIQDYLAKMQHYGLPTRLLDVTSSIEVAAFFASSKETMFGEIFMFQFPEDDVQNKKHQAVEKLASLSVLSDQYKNYILDPFQFSSQQEVILNAMKKAYTNIDTTIKRSDFMDYKIVLDSISNDRVFNQKGSFILYGLDFPDLSRDKSITTRIIVYNKDKIRKELDKKGIHQLSMFPELDQTCEYIKSKYK